MKFFIINNNLFDDSKYAYGEQVEQITGDYEKCKVCGRAINMRRWLKPLKVKLSKPLYGDFIFGPFATFLASERFKQMYEISELKGIKEFEKVEIAKISRIKSNSLQPPNYYNVLIERSSTRVDEVKSNILREGHKICNYCREGGIINSFEGIFLKEDTWDGKDIFFPIGLSGAIVVSQRFFDFIKNNEFTNINLVPAEQYSTPWMHK